MNTLRIPQSARLVPQSESMLLARRLAARRAWLESRRRIRELKQAERAARIKAAQDRALERWAEERARPKNVVRLEDVR